MSEIIYPKSSDEVFYRKNNSISLCHGSKEVVEKPRFGKGEVNNDYGRGFYTVSAYDEELAKEWACSPFNKTGVGYVNQYDLDTTDLEVLDFDKMDIIYWIVLTATCREPNIDADNGFAACVRNNRTKGRYLYDYLVEFK